MLGLRKRQKVSGYYIWAFVEYDAIDNIWRHIDGLPGKQNFIFANKTEAVKHIGNNGLDPYQWEIVEEKRKKGQPS